MPTPILIADDEEAPRAQLREALQAVWPDAKPVHECANGVDAWDAFLEHGPQACFLDVRMPGLTGIDVARRIGARAAVVFVAAPGDQAIASFLASAVEPLLKPVDAAQLAAAIERMRAQLAEPETHVTDFDGLLDRVSSRLRKVVPLEAIQVGSGRDLRMLRLEDVVYMASDARATRVVCGDGEVLVRTPLKQLLAQVDGGFFWQIHRSVLVNRRHIAQSLRGADDGMVVTLHGRSERLPVARHFQGLFGPPY